MMRAIFNITLIPYSLLSSNVNDKFLLFFSHLKKIDCLKQDPDKVYILQLVDLASYLKIISLSLFY